MEYELKPPPTESRAFTRAHRWIVYSWTSVWGLLMVWVFDLINSQDGGWFDGPEFAAAIAGIGLAVGLVVLGTVVGVIRLAIRDNSVRTLLLLVVPASLVVWALVAAWS